MLHKTNKCIGVVSLVTKEDWTDVCQDVKNQCTFATNGLILELDRRFPTQKLMNTIGIIYPQYWVQSEVALSSLCIYKF